MIFNDMYDNAKGHLQIYKIFEDGRKELHYEDKNIICSGMGVTLAEAFAADIDDPITDYLITLFQVGTGGTPSLQVSSNGRLGTALTGSEYGDGSLSVLTHDLSASGTVYSNESFGEIPTAFIDKVAADKVRWRLIIDENAGNGKTLNEVGLFSFNPSKTSPTPTSYLCAYREFNQLSKTNEFALDIRWTITF